MGHFLEVAFRILEAVGKPLSHKELVEIGLTKGMLKTQGETPWQTMKSKLSTDILKKKNNSLFMRADKGKFALRTWTEQTTNEYIAQRYQKALLDEEIVVFHKSSLRRYLPTNGISNSVLENSNELLNECFPMQRRIAEGSFSVIQLVSGFLVHYKNEFITYKRTKRLPESRLHHSYSVMFGGHLNPDDVPPLFDIFKPEFGQNLLLRELHEEIIIEKPIVTYKGLLYDDSRDVSSQHLCLIFDVELSSRDYEIGERGFLQDPKFETKSDMLKRVSDFENWSVLIINSPLIGNSYE